MAGDAPDSSTYHVPQAFRGYEEGCGLNGECDVGQFCLSHLLVRAAAVNSDGVATIYQDRSRTWSEHTIRVSRFASALRALGIDEGDRVAILAPNSDLYLEAVYAIMWAGAIVVPLNTRLTPLEIEANLSDSGANLLIADPALWKSTGLSRVMADLSVVSIGAQDEGRLAFETLISEHDEVPPSPPPESGIAAIVYSGGTTGRSKGVAVSHSGIMVNALQSISELAIRPDSRWLHSVPLFHIAGIGHTVAIAAKAATHVIADKFNPANTIALISSWGCTHVALVPTMVAMIMEAYRSKPDAEISSLQYIQYGGAAMPEAVLSSALELWPNVKFVQFYGQTESGPIITSLPPQYHQPGNPKLRSVGLPVSTYLLEIWDAEDRRLPTGQIGEIVGRSPSVMTGYWNRPELTSAAFRHGWLHTGDVGYLDEEGFLHVVDRLKDVIISGGENIYSAEVEQVLYSHPAVDQCAVIGIEDPLWGERVHAIVKWREGMDSDEETLTDHCRQRIAGYKIPRSYTLSRDDLPLSAAGKILKSELRKRYDFR